MCPNCGLQIIGCDCDRLRYIRVGDDLNTELKTIDVGERVKIYEDPFTELQLEGEAVIVLTMNQKDAWEGRTVRYCEVVFDFDKMCLNGEKFRRSILTNEPYKQHR
jgi:hypothetical protein